MMGMNLSRSTRKEFLSRDPAGDKESKNAGFPNTAKTPEQNVMKKKANCTCPTIRCFFQQEEAKGLGEELDEAGKKPR